MIRGFVTSALFCAAALLSPTVLAAPAGKAAPAALPPYAQAYEPQGVDERGMWMEADEQERQIRDSSFVIKDAALNAYVRSVFCRTVGDERCRNVRIYVMRIPAFNATMYPNGMMTLWSGLLLRVKDEAELGSVLGHEFGHFELRHSLKGFSQERASTDLLAWTSLLIPNLALSSAIVGNFYAFNRAQEKEADLKGLNYLASSPYPSSSAASVWNRLMAEEDATAAGRKRKVTARSYSAGFFASHPTDLARAAYLREAAAKAADEGDPGATAYHAGMAKWLPAFLDDQIKLNDFGGTEYLLGQLASDGWTAELLYARAELYRARGNPRDLVTASQFYQEAIAKGLARPEAQRGLGFSLLRSQQVEPGKAALKRYLELAPNASDAPMIATLVAN